jgi:alpha-tubulin suppressor-like RCC1 family protein
VNLRLHEKTRLRPPRSRAGCSAGRGRTLERAASIALSAAFAASFLGLTSPASPAAAATPEVRSGKVVVWGTRTHPVLTKFPPTALSGVVAISASPAGDDAMALKIDGTVISWGANEYGQARPPFGLTDVVAVSMGDRFALALKSDGSVVAWGDDSLGQTDVPEAAQSGVKSIAAGIGFAIAEKEDGSLVTWGSSPYGATVIPADAHGKPVANVGSMSAANDVVAVRTDRTVVAWGDDSHGQTRVPGYVRGVRTVSAGLGFTVALTTDGSILGWGDDSENQLVVPCATFSGQVCAEHETGFKAVAAGGHHTLALRSNGTVAAWGRDVEHQTEVPRNTLHVIAVAAGSSFSMALVQQFAPNAPTAVTATRGNRGAVVSWQPPDGDGGTAITGYEIVASPGGRTCQTYDPDALSCVVAPLDNGTSYTFTVAAINAAGTGPASAPSGAIVPQAIGPVLTPAPTPRPAPTPPAPPGADVAVTLLLIGLVSLLIGFLPGLRRLMEQRRGLVGRRP